MNKNCLICNKIFFKKAGRTLCKDCHRQTMTYGYRAIKMKELLSNENIGN